ncbi:MAG: CoA-binding protein [bacterium]
MAESCEIPSINNRDEEIKQILSSCKTIAVVGISPKEERPSFGVAKYLIERGYIIFPVNPGCKIILEKKCYPSLLDIHTGVDIVNIFRRPEFVEEIIDQAVKIKAKVVWMQEGIVNNKAAKKARDNGIKVVMDKCLYKEHVKLETGKDKN